MLFDSDRFHKAASIESLNLRLGQDITETLAGTLAETLAELLA